VRADLGTSALCEKQNWTNFGTHWHRPTDHPTIQPSNSCNSYLNTLCSVFYALDCMHCIVCIVLHALYSMYCILCIVLYSLHFIHCIISIVVYAFHSMHCILCIIFYALYSMHCILNIVFHALYQTTGITWYLTC
jgi:hypothetical protein